MSPRAAWRLEALGFAEVYDYVRGKADWLAAGLPTEGGGRDEEWAVDVVESVPTCTPETPMEHLPDADPVVVVNGQGIVLGQIDDGHRRGADAAHAMDPGPTTVRANEPLRPLIARMRDHGVPHILVTTPDGHLIGIVRS